MVRKAPLDAAVARARTRYPATAAAIVGAGTTALATDTRVRLAVVALVAIAVLALVAIVAIVAVLRAR